MNFNPTDAQGTAPPITGQVAAGPLVNESDSIDPSTKRKTDVCAIATRKARTTKGRLVQNDKTQEQAKTGKRKRTERQTALYL